ncbi:MAG TPA: hypothetical protein VIY29_12955 [Ktedonobacteraceae bacterium]
MHAVLEADNGITFMASDTPDRMEYTAGTNFSMSLSGDNEAELKGYFEKLSVGGNSDGYVAKLNPTGTRLVYSTYLGGSGADGSNGSGVGIDQGCDSRNQACSVFFNGFTTSVNFPTTAGAFQRSLAGGFDVFSVRLTFDDNGNAPVLVRRGPASSTPRQSGSLPGRAGLLCKVSPLGCFAPN